MQKQKKKVIGFNILEVIIIIIISGLTSSIATGIITSSNNRTSAGLTYSELLQDDDIKEFLDVYADVLNGYYQNVDKNKAIDSAISGMMDYLGDKYTTYLNDNETDNLNDMLSGSYKGIGIMVSKGNDTEDIDNPEIGAIVEQVFDDSPAQKANMLKGDHIIEIKGENVKGKSLEEITTLIKESNNEIKIKVVRNNSIVELNVQVTNVTKPAISYEVKKSGNRNVGYLDIDTFSSSVVTQVKNALKKMEDEKIEGLIIDLRNNGGGYLTSATDIASLFIEKGKTIYSLESKDDYQTLKDETDERRNYNIVIITNEATASASEILTSALKDSYGVKIVGKKTYGKGKVQQTKTLSDGTMVKYTTAKWLRPNGECVDGVGISPDYEIDLEVNEEGIAIDTQLNKALEIIFD
ncbi:MAG: PDZ domain-containing protein [Bacilli bacterium]|nr:PDZ domain-containing protein [Bacilli bacterium]